MDDEIRSSLKDLALSVRRTVDDGIAKGTLKPEDEPFFRWKVDKFQYTDKGPTYSQARGESLAKPSWFHATIKLTESIKKSNEYNIALDQLNNAFGKIDALPLHLESFIGKLIHRHLHDSKLSDDDVDVLIETFLKDLRGEPIKCGADVELQGIVLRPEKIEPDFGIIIRQTRIEDLENEVPEHGFARHDFPPHPSAIMSIDSVGRAGPEIQERVEEAIIMLRLFKIGSVKWTRYHLRSESVIGIAGGTLISGSRTGALETYLVTQEDVVKLKKFWQTMSRAVPENFIEFGIKKPDHLSIAYKRYSDALLENGLLERRIANAVMGLEALLLKPGEIQELPYRLGVRVAKLFSLLGHDPHEIRKTIGDAYRVRSLFAHGGQLSYERRRKLEAKYKDVKVILLSALEYLRILIITMILSRRGKSEFIDLVDDSLVDRKREEFLNSIISSARDILGVKE